MSHSSRHSLPLALLLLLGPLGASALDAQQCPAAGRGELPLKYAGQPTVAAITPCDLMTRLYVFADDSMRGRRAATPDNVRATNYIAGELARLGLKPAGDSGGFFQFVPVVARAIDTMSTIVVAGTTLRAGVDFLVSTSAMHTGDLKGMQVLYGGALLDTTVKLSANAVQGKIVLFSPIPQGMDGGAVQRTPTGIAWVQWYNTIRNRATANAAQISPQAVRNATNPAGTVMLIEHDAAVTLTLTTGAVEVLFGAPLARVPAGTVSKPFELNLRFIDSPRPTRNVVAVLPGSDAKLKGEFVALGAHSDHVGMGRGGSDHDSVRAVGLGSEAGAMGAASRKQTTEDEEYDRITRIMDSLHKARPVRMDSVNNGADDGGSGTVALLEIAEAFAKGSIKPRRSILFVWHTGTEANPQFYGSTWFTDHPTVPRDSIVAELNVDMIGRGEATDQTGVTKDERPLHGNPDYLQIIGSRRLSTELGALVEAANTESGARLRFDYSPDADGHPDRLYCRNDQASYSRYGIPSVFFTTGYHADFRQVTDEPQYIQYPHLARVAQLVSATALKIANLDHRPVVDKPKPDPKAACTQ